MTGLTLERVGYGGPGDATAAYRSGATTVTTLMILSARYALIVVADLCRAV